MAVLHSVPIAARPPKSWTRVFKALLFFLLFNFGCLAINTSQLVFLLPLRVLPFSFARHLYVEGNRSAKGAFGCLLSMFRQYLLC